ncbi:S-protein [Citrus sinensis]|nr:S-protein [Citrus sinensis]
MRITDGHECNSAWHTKTKISKLAACQAPITNSLLNHFTEHVINNLNNSSTLEAHCKSKDDDLGLRRLAAGTEFNWTFRVNFWSTTLFFCDLRWANGHKAFDVYCPDDQFLAKKCAYNFCRRSARDDGIYAFSEKKNHYVLAHKWDPK